jgi:hypothetical protein
MQDIFETKFDSNQEKFMEFILAFIQDNKKMVDNYYTLNVDENQTEMTNPFKIV